MQEYIYPTKEKALMGETLAASADLSVMMGVNLTEANSGDMIVYTVSIANHGPDAAIAPTVTDALPAVLENHEFSVDNGANWSAWQGSYTLPDIAPGLTYILMLRGTAAIEARGSYQNTAEVASATPDPNHADNTARSAATQYLPTAELSLAVAGEQIIEPLAPNIEWVVYTITAANNGPAAAVNPFITALPIEPDQLGNIGVSLDGQATWSEWTETIPLDDLAAGGSVTVYLRGQYMEGITKYYGNLAFVSSDNYNPKHDVPAISYVGRSGNERCSFAIKSLTVIDKPNPKPGDTVVYRCVAGHTGDLFHASIILFYTAPPQLYDVEYSTSLNPGARLPWSGSYREMVTMGYNRILYIRAKVKKGISGTINNTFYVVTEARNQDPEDNIATITTPIADTAHLSVGITADRRVCNPGDEICYTVIAANHGPATAAGLTLSCALPAAIQNPRYSLDNRETDAEWTNGVLYLPDLPVNASANLLVWGALPEAAAGSLAATATVTAATQKPDGSMPNMADASTDQSPGGSPVWVGAADLALSMAADRAAAHSNELVSYTVTVLNRGPETALAPTLTVGMPGALENQMFSADGGKSWNPWLGNCILPDLRGGQAIAIWLRGRAGVEARGNLYAAAQVTSVTPDPGVGDNRSTAAVSFLPTAGLVVTKTSDAGELVNSGDTVNYTVTVLNDGPAIARSIRLTDTPSAWLEDTQYNSGGGPDDWGLWIANDYVPLPDLNPGESRQIFFKGKVMQDESGEGGSIYNRATVSSDNYNPPQLFPAWAIVSTSLGNMLKADLTINVAVADGSTILPGQRIEYQVVCHSYSELPNYWNQSVLYYTPPSELRDVEYRLDGKDWYPWSESLSFSFIYLNQIDYYFYFRGTVASGVTGSIHNTFFVSSNELYDPDLSRNIVALDIPVVATTTLSVSKRSEKTVYYPGDEVRYFITIENSGPSAANAPVVSDTLPDGLQNPRYSLDGGLTDDAWTGSVTLPQLFSGGAATLLIWGALGDMASGSLDSTAIFRSGTVNSDGGENIVEANTVNRPYVVDTAILTVTKESDKTEYFPGETVTYTIKAANSGATLAKAPLATDRLPAVIQNPQYSIDGEPRGTWTGTAYLPDIVPGGSATLEITGTLGGKATGSLANTVTVETETATPTGGENRADAVTANNPYVADTAVLTAAKASDKTAYRKGEAITYTITVANTGAAAAKASIVSDALTMLENGATYSIDGVAYGLWTGTATLPDIAPGGQSALVITGTLSADIMGAVSNTATIESGTLDPTGQKIYIEASSTAEVTGVTAVALSLSVIPESPFVPGKRITYEVLAYNGGSAKTVNLRLEYTPPAELIDVQYTESSGQWMPWPGTLPLGELISGGDAKVQVRGTVAPDMTGAVVSSFTAAYDNPDTDISDNNATSRTNIIGTAALSAVKTSNKKSYRPSERIAYTITVGNAGPAAAIAPLVTDPLNALILAPRYSVGGGSEADWLGSATLPDIAPGGKAALVITGTLAANAAGSLANTANVTSTALAPGGGRNSVDAKTSDSPNGDPFVTDTVIPPATGSAHQAITDLIQSVALQEAALSHILNAEGEKIQKIIQSGATSEQMLALNDSVFKLVSAATRLEMIFQSKLELFAGKNYSAPKPPPKTPAAK